MKVLFVNTYEIMTVGMRYIAAYLEKNGYSVDICTISSYDKKKITNIIEEKNPDILGFTCFSHGINKVLKIASIIKQRYPKKIVVLGNIHATLYYYQLLKRYDFIDYIILGEGEMPMNLMMQYLYGYIKITEVNNLAYRAKNNKICKNTLLEKLPSLDEIPHYPKNIDPVISGLNIVSDNFFLYLRRPVWAWKDLSKGVAVLCSSRGCIYNCEYCPEYSMSKGIWRAQSAETLVKAIQEIKESFKINNFYFVDPVFALSRKRTIEICNHLIKNKLNISWGFQTHPHTIDEEMVHILRKAGCASFMIGIEGYTPQTVIKYRKVTINYKKLGDIINIARKLGIMVKINIVSGWLDEDLLDIAKSFFFNMRFIQPSLFSVYYLKLLPGSKLFKEKVKEGMLEEDYWLQNDRLVTIDGKKPKTKQVLKNIANFILINILCILNSDLLRAIIFFFFTLAKNIKNLFNKSMKI